MSCLSIIIPVYNEKYTIIELLKRVKSVDLINGINKEIIIVDDGSDDGTVDILRNLDNTEMIKIIFCRKNSGKGSAIREGLQLVTGDFVIVQDADLEYDPNDYNLLLSKMLNNNLSVVYGSRGLKKQERRYASKTFYYGGLLINKLTNLLYGLSLTDEATCYKLFRTDLLKSLPLRCRRFEFCPEVTALVARRGFLIEEVGISYFPRDKSSGKKIKLVDGLEAIWTLVKYRFLHRL